MKKHNLFIAKKILTLNYELLMKSYSSTMKNSLVIIIFPDMMKKYLISFIVVSFISIIACFLAMPDKRVSLFEANVEALTSTEGSMMIECDNFSLTMICQKTCVCGYTWQTLQGYGHAVRLHGTCVCGRTWN